MVTLLDRALDASIVLSFDRSGFRRHQRDFHPGDLAGSLAGKVALVTGANSGLGLEAARGLAGMGATVHLLCRDRARGEAALARLKAEQPPGRLLLEVLDVSSLAAIRAYAESGAPSSIDVLIHNAGILPETRALTAEGLESTWATNLVGPFLLTERLRPRLGAGARVVQVSSGGMYSQRLDLCDPLFERRPFDGVVAYANTKRAEVVLNELWAARDPGHYYAAMHPGWADTPSVRSALPRFYRLTRGILRTPAEGADTVIWLSACPELPGPSGAFWFDRRVVKTHLRPGTVEPAETRTALWERLQADAAR